MTGVENIIMHIHIWYYMRTVCTHAHELHVHDANVPYYCIIRYACCSDSQVIVHADTIICLFIHKFKSLLYKV